MKKTLLLLFIITLITISCGETGKKTSAGLPKKAVSDTPKDFRYSDWGATPEEVKSTETAQFMQESDITIAYKDKILGLDVVALYHFEAGRLYSGSYLFTVAHNNKNQYITDYNTLKKNLTNIYGNPLSDETGWHNEKYKDDKLKWGIAVSLGHLTYLAAWATETTRISLMLTGKEQSLKISLFYDSK